MERAGWGSHIALKNVRIHNRAGTGAGSQYGDMNGREFIVRARRWARSRKLGVRFMASEGAGSHGTLYVGDRKTTVKDRRKEIGKGLLARMLADLGVDRDGF